MFTDVLQECMLQASPNFYFLFASLSVQATSRLSNYKSWCKHFFSLSVCLENGPTSCIKVRHMCALDDVMVDHRRRTSFSISRDFLSEIRIGRQDMELGHCNNFVCLPSDVTPYLKVMRLSVLFL